jgi:hypothetical protein
MMKKKKKKVEKKKGSSSKIDSMSNVWGRKGKVPECLLARSGLEVVD